MKAIVCAATLALATTAVYGAAFDTGNLTDGAEGQWISIEGQIGPDDFAAFKLKANRITTGKIAVVLSGPGGNPIAAMQIGEFVRLKGWATFVFDECDSSCAAIWLAGTPRIMAPKALIGFHSASINGQENGTGNALFGAYMNRLGLGYDAIFWATTAGPRDISYLTSAKAKEIGIDVNVIEPDTKQAATPLSPPPPQHTAPLPPPLSPDVAPGPWDPEKQTAELVSSIIRSFNGSGLYYSDLVNYHGKMLTNAEVEREQNAYRHRWSVRNHTIKSIAAKCEPAMRRIPDTCTVTGVVDFTVRNGAKMLSGSTAFEFVLQFASTDSNVPADWRITSEDGKVLSSRMTADASAAPPSTPKSPPRQTPKSPPRQQP